MLVSMVDLKILAVVLGTIAMFTLVANVIPQVESDVPEDVSFGADVTPEELVEAGRTLYEGAGGCIACHAESAGARGPNLLTDQEGLGLIGERCDGRVEGMTCKDYLHESLVQPQSHMVGDYPPIMPPADRALSSTQIWALVAYLESIGGEVTVTGADLEASQAAGPDTETADAADASGSPAKVAFQSYCAMCHAIDGEGGVVGPPLDGVGARMTADQIRAEILNPGNQITEGYEDLAGIMPATFEQQLDPEQLDALVAYLSELR